MTQLKEICSVCKRPTRSSEKGSLTGFLFENLYCQCGVVGADASKPSDVHLCPSCGLSMPEVERVGSFTSYLFQDIRCSCSKKDRESLSKSGGRMALRTRYRVDPAMHTNATERRTSMKARRMLTSIDSIARVGLVTGEVIGNYQLEELIGEGGMGLVFKGRHVQLGRNCAIKILAPTVRSEASWNMFHNEAKIVAGLNHEGICQIYDFGVHKEQLPFYVMDYLEGETLEQVLQKQGTLSVGAVIEVFIKLADVVSYASGKGVIHKDIKPANIMLLTPTQSGIGVKLLDFGIAELTVSNQEQDADIVGTAAYMSPERFFGGVLDQRLDIYSLGCSMFEALTGSLPYQSDVFEELMRQHALDEIPMLRSRTGVEFPLELEAVIRRCLGKTPDDRYPNASELSADLRAILENNPLAFAKEQLLSIKEDATTASAAVAPPPKNKTLQYALIGLALTGLLVFLLMIALYWDLDRKKISINQHATETKQPHMAASWPEPVPTELVDSLDSAIMKDIDLEHPKKLIWLTSFDNPRLGRCKAVIQNHRIKFHGDVEKEIVSDHKGTTYVNKHKADGSWEVLTDTLKARNEKMFRGFTAKPVGKDKIRGLNCTRYSFVTATGERGLYWTTEDFTIVNKVLATGFAWVCDMPPGYGMPVRMLYLDKDSKPMKPVFDMRVAEHISETMLQIRIQVLERQEMEEREAQPAERTKYGGIVTRQPDGSVETVWENGVVRVDAPGGIGFLRKKDGTVEHWGPTINDCYVRTLTLDGRRSSKYRDGTVLFEDLDGTLTYKYTSGAVAVWRISRGTAKRAVDLGGDAIVWVVDSIDPSGRRSVQESRGNPPYLDEHDAISIAQRQRKAYR